MDGEYNVMRIKICVQWTVTILYLLLNCFVNVNKIKISGTYIGTLDYNVKTMFTMSIQEKAFLSLPAFACTHSSKDLIRTEGLILWVASTLNLWSTRR